jgi:hypothetical protein
MVRIRSATSFVTSQGITVSLAQRRVLARLLAALVMSSEGDRKVATWQYLVRSTWPGERISPRHARIRLRVAVAALRTLGLREVLLTARNGYALSGSFIVEKT